MDLEEPGDKCPTSFKLSNGYVLPQGKLTPNTLFVGGIDMMADENEIGDFFARFGTVSDVKIISYRGGICKGYGFIYFSDQVDIQKIIELKMFFKGKTLKLGPAIMKERSSRMYSRPTPNRPIGQNTWASPPPVMYCSFCINNGVAVPIAVPVMGGSNLYTQLQPYPISSAPGGVMFTQVPMSYTQNVYSYQCTPWAGGDHLVPPMNPGWIQ